MNEPPDWKPASGNSNPRSIVVVQHMIMVVNSGASAKFCFAYLAASPQSPEVTSVTYAIVEVSMCFG